MCVKRGWVVKTLCLVLTISILILTAIPISSALNNTQEDSGIDVNAKSAILIEASTGKVLYEKNADEALPPASVTKIMTLLLVMESLESGKILKIEI